MHNAIDDLNLDRLVVSYPGRSAYKLADNIEVVPHPSVSVNRRAWPSRYERGHRVDDCF